MSVQNLPSTTIIIFAVLIISCYSLSDQNYFSSHGIMRGLGFPSQIDAIVGEDIFLKITEPVSKQTKCVFRRTGSSDTTPPKNNVELWKSEKCGILIKNVSLNDSGVWRLTSSADDDIARGVILLNIRENEINLIDQKNHTYSSNIDITPNGASYCYVIRPEQTKSQLPQHSKCTLPEIYDERDANGIWNVVSGVKGKTEEISFQVNVVSEQAKIEELTTSVEFKTENTPGLFMKCKLVNTKRTINFCRFSRLIDDIGFNLIQGQGSTKYRYYGDGFENHECGIKITNPDENDRSPWKCYLGVEENKITKTIGAILDGSAVSEVAQDIEADDVYGLHHSRVNILCKRQVAAEYCWFRHPTGRKISVSDMNSLNEADPYHYYGMGIKLGECGISIMSASVDDSGTWSCHMGTIAAAGIEFSKEISVRVSESHLVSSSLFQDAPSGTSLLLECKTVPMHLPVKYCRYVLPDGTAFSINEQSTADNLLLGNFYFNPNRKMKSGYCSIIVQKVTKRHIGQWTCASLLAGHSHESWDDFRVNVFDNELSTAAIVGMAIGVVALIGGTALVAFITYKRRFRFLSPRINTQDPINPDAVSHTSSEAAVIPMSDLQR